MKLSLRMVFMVFLIYCFTSCKKEYNENNRISFIGTWKVFSETRYLKGTPGYINLDTFQLILREDGYGTDDRRDRLDTLGWFYQTEPEHIILLEYYKSEKYPFNASNLSTAFDIKELSQNQIRIVTNENTTEPKPDFLHEYRNWLLIRQ